MFCPNCGTKLEENNTFCTACGAPVEPDSMERPAESFFPDPTVLPTPEKGRIDPRDLPPEPQPEQEIDLSSVVENLNKREPEPIFSKNGFTDKDMEWFTDHQPQEQYPPRVYNPQNQQIPPSSPVQANPPYFSQIPVPVDLTPRKSNVLLGFIGALVFSLIGSVIWVLIGTLGFISYLGALAMSFLVITGYKLLGKRFDMAGLLTSLLVVAAAVFASNVFIHAIELSDGLTEIKEEIMAEVSTGDYGLTETDVNEVLSLIGIYHTGVIDVFLHFFDYAGVIDRINDYGTGHLSTSILGTFWLNLGLSYLFAGIAFVVVAVPQWKASN